jgi:hypothetical protein
MATDDGKSFTELCLHQWWRTEHQTWQGNLDLCFLCFWQCLDTSIGVVIRYHLQGKVQQNVLRAAVVDGKTANMSDLTNMGLTHPSVLDQVLEAHCRCLTHCYIRGGGNQLQQGKIPAVSIPNNLEGLCRTREPSRTNCTIGI